MAAFKHCPALWLVTLVVLAGCSAFPKSGPSRREVDAAGNVELIDLTDTVARQLLAERKETLFSDDFPSTEANSERIGPGDVLEVSVWEAPPAALFSSSALRDSGLSVSNMTAFPSQAVNSAGTIYVPFAGPVRASGQTLEEIASTVARQLEGKANQPQVLVRRVNNNSAYAIVVGDVEKSVRVPLTPRGEHLLDALAEAGGTKDPIAKVTLQLTRGAITHALPLDRVIRDPRQNVPLRAGDVVTALYQPLSFTALGATGKSEEINFEAQGITLAQALARAGGLEDLRANPKGVFIFRLEPPEALEWPKPPVRTPDGKVPVVYRVDLTDPRSFFVAQSFKMENKDVVYVANAPVAELQKFLNLLVTAVYPVEGVVTIAK